MSKNIYKNIHLPAVQIRGHVAFFETALSLFVLLGRLVYNKKHS